MVRRVPYKVDLSCRDMIDRYDKEEEEKRQEHEPFRRPSLRADNTQRKQNRQHINRNGKAASAETPLCIYGYVCTYNNAVIPREDGQLVQASNQVPPRGDVARYEDPESEDRKRVHESIN